MSIRPYVTYNDVKTVCPFLDQLPKGDDEFLFQRQAARAWMDAAITAAYGSPGWGTIAVDFRVIRACAYRAASEILVAQMTPISQDNAYERLALKFQRMAENEISTMVVKIVPGFDQPGTACHFLQLGVYKRGIHG